MAEKTRDELKSYFESGKRPTGQQFADLIDSVLNKQDDAISIDGSDNIGIGTDTPGARLGILADPAGGENLFRATVGDAPDDYFSIRNATGAINQFIPVIKGYHASDNRAALIMSGEIPPEQDNGNNSVVTFDARQSGGPVTTRPLFQWSSHTDIKMTMDAEGNLGIGTASPNAKLDVNGAASVSESLSSQNGKVRRDFITWHTTAGGATPIHIKTNIPRISNTMYRILVEGYAYGAGHPINSEVVGYAYGAEMGIVNGNKIDHAPGVSIDQYYSTDEFIVIRLTPTSTYYLGFSASAWFTNPNGNGFNISAQVFHQGANL